VFRVRRAIYTDPELFEREMELIFHACWIYLCHESQLTNHGDFLTTTIGTHPVFVIRGSDGTLGAYFNACPHRGNQLISRKSGNTQIIACKYHGWCFNADGRCTLVRGAEEGYDATSLARINTNLRAIGKLATYKGFVFGSISNDVPELKDFLGEALPFIDLIADQSPQGMKVLRGESRYVINANWKLQTDNSTDGYHVASLHRNFATALAFRGSIAGISDDALDRTESSRILDLTNIESGGYDVGNGHMVNWSDRGSPAAAPLSRSRESLLSRHSEAKVRWMVERGHIVTIFPNVLFNDVASTCIRVWRPVAVNRTEADTWCIAPVGEDPEALQARIRKYEDFFLPTSLAVPDDTRAMEGTHRGSQANGDEWNDLSLGASTAIDGPDAPADEIGVVPQVSNPGRESETSMHGFYREWARRMEPVP